MALDQFYTKSNVAQKCYNSLQNIINIDEYDILLEPSAGKGAFYLLLPANKRVGIDIDPKHREIAPMNFFEYIPDKSKKYAVIGNPPFGKVSSSAIKFFNTAAEFSDTIAFILPLTFKRVSVQNQLNMKFHLIFNENLSQNPCCFEPTMNAKCCFQIWQKKRYIKNSHKIPQNSQGFYFSYFWSKR